MRNRFLANSLHVNDLCESEVSASALPLLGGLHVEGPLDDSGPLQAADDECVGLGPLRLHQLAL